MVQPGRSSARNWQVVEFCDRDYKPVEYEALITPASLLSSTHC